MRKKLLILSLKFVFFLLLLQPVTQNLKPNNAYAQSNTLTVTPQLTSLDLATDDPETLIYYKNSSSTPIELTLSVQDVKELEDRNPVGILDAKEAANYKYSLSSWVTLERQTLLLNPGEERTVKVTIAEEKLSPGGHYGTILAEIRQKEGNEKIKLKGVIASLLFVRADTGNEVEEAKVGYFGADISGIAFPKSFIMRFQNIGNVELIPYGTIEVKSGKGTIVARGIINEDSLITLPEAIRRYDIPVTKLDGLLLPGKYKATLNLHYGKSNKKITLTTDIITQGSFDLIKIGFMALAGLVVIFIAWKLIQSGSKARNSNLKF